MPSIHDDSTAAHAEVAGVSRRKVLLSAGGGLLGLATIAGFADARRRRRRNRVRSGNTSTLNNSNTTSNGNSSSGGAGGGGGSVVVTVIPN